MTPPRATIEAIGAALCTETTSPRLWAVERSGAFAPLDDAGDFDVERHILASLSVETLPLLPAALARHLAAGDVDALTLLVVPRAAPERTRHAEAITAFLASGPWARPLVRAGDCSAVELCYRALSDAICGHGSPVVLAIVDRDEPMAASPDIAASIDVIVPHRGNDDHLRGALASLRNQTCASRRLVCFDQGAGAEEVRRFGDDPAVELHQLLPHPGGPYVVRQHFLLTSCAPYVAFQDSDDLSLPDRLARLVASVEGGEADIVGSHELRCDEITRLAAAIRYPLDVNRALAVGDGSVQLFPATLARTDVLQRLGGFSTRRTFAADRHFQIRASRTARIRNLDAFLYVRRRRADSLSTAPGTGMDSPERRRLNREWDEALGRMRDGDASDLPVEHGDRPFAVRNLRDGSIVDAVMQLGGSHERLTVSSPAPSESIAPAPAPIAAVTIP